ncbi:hypothetical protein [Paenibacillus radicis (ex Xue et al. 2023)]|uniref:Uncharacterized protein n=1 Tax=Paenibacillus radicis (ex Xue et al. 2023) TaxID=2972489 RepID=A0ABT1YDA7_9BACL|nr:hypothetical protein [Paenibacillus radicis (ex Xue et al. 2023)]MCR8631157.1 hypothetical protein [Paenibacillus radicis (ex Xue et al. 2023)]
MLWSEVRDLFPDQFVLVEELKSHYEDSMLHVEEVAVIKPIQDAQEAWKELFSAKNERFVYHTSNENIVIEVRTKPMIRRLPVHES